MTEEKIREIRRRHVDEVFKPGNFTEEDGFEQYKSAAHVVTMQLADELLSRAYEEAARVAETPNLQGDWNCQEPTVAAEIRGLASSLKGKE